MSASMIEHMDASMKHNDIGGGKVQSQGLPVTQNNPNIWIEKKNKPYMNGMAKKLTIKDEFET